MNYFHLLPLLWVIQASFTDDSAIRRDLNFTALAEKDGYTAEQHYVVTKDGYILSIFRIPVGKTCSKNKGPILFGHGLYLSGDDCIVPGPGKAHCYIYSDNCYDVWVLNVRGNVYSRNHTSLNPDKDLKFWDFTFDDMALCDLPAVIDYILTTTNFPQLSYVGHSQGVTILLVLCAKIPEYNAKIKIGFGLSATAYMYHAKFIVIQLQGVLEPLLTATGPLLAAEIFHRGGLAQNAAKFLCGTSDISYPLCSYILFALLGYNEYQITSDVLPVVMGHAPSGTSLKNFNRWGQLKNNGFCEYNYGFLGNLKVYGKDKPTKYDTSKITMEWRMIASDNDWVANLTDVKLLTSELPKATLYEVPDKHFAHLDFIYGRDIPKYITPIVLSILETGSYNP